MTEANTINMEELYHKGDRRRRRNHEGHVMLLDYLCPVHSSSVSILSYRLYPSPFSNVSNEYVARYARS